MSKNDEKSTGDSQVAEIYKDLKRAEKEANLWKNKYQSAVKGKVTEPIKGDSEKSESIQGQSTGNQATTHSFKFFQQYCTDCGEKNPEFKDETKCKGCGTHLGSLDSALKMKACPSCGGKSVEPITDEAVRRAKEILHVA